MSWFRLGIALENIAPGDQLEIDLVKGYVRKLRRETIEREHKEAKANKETEPVRKKNPHSGQGEQ